MFNVEKILINNENYKLHYSLIYVLLKFSYVKLSLEVF